MRHRLPIAAAVLLVGLAAGACGATSTADRVQANRADATSSSADPSATLAPPASVAATLGQLSALRVQPRRRAVGYDRDAFGPAWADVDGNGCNQRDDVLLRDAVPGSAAVGRQGSCDHDVLAGTWVDPYTGRRLVETDMKDLAQARAVQIDHVVPLAEAWVSGADRWSDARREQFAADESELLAVDGLTNESKGDDDPAAWRPRQQFQCAYAERWIAVKVSYDLAADRPEKRALRQLLGAC